MDAEGQREDMEVGMSNGPEGLRDSQKPSENSFARA